MARILGIDYGAKRVGVAATDLLQMIASPLTTIAESEIFKFLKSYLRDEDVEAIVVGYPTRWDGTDTHSTPLIRQFIQKLKDEFPSIEVYLEDEAHTSQKAMQAMVEGGMKKKDRRKKENLDKISASIILQSFLENRDR